MPDASAPRRPLAWEPGEPGVAVRMPCTLRPAPPRPPALEPVTCADLLSACTHPGGHLPVGLDGKPALLDRFAHPDRDRLVHSPVVPWRPTDPAPLPPSYLEAVARYLAADRNTPAQQRPTCPATLDDDLGPLRCDLPAGHHSDQHYDRIRRAVWSLDEPAPPDPPLPNDGPWPGGPGA